MKSLMNIIRRDVKLFFKDKGAFISSLITPLILLVLYATFLAKVYYDSFSSALPDGFKIDSSLLDGIVVSQLVSSLLAVSCVTVAFCSNLLMITDKSNGFIKDFYITPIKRSKIAWGYFISSAFSTLIVTLTALCASFIYLAVKGWYLSTGDVFCVILDVVLLTLFGVALSSCINFFLSSNGQASAVGTIVSAGYGFVCGAYMPISNFSAGLQNVLMFLPGTYGTSLIRNHMMRGVFAEMSNIGFPKEAIADFRDSVDCNIYFFQKSVSTTAMYAVLCGSIALFIGIFVLLNMFVKKKRK